MGLSFPKVGDCRRYRSINIFIISIAFVLHRALTSQKDKWTKEGYPSKVDENSGHFWLHLKDVTQCHQKLSLWMKKREQMAGSYLDREADCS